MIEAWVAAKNAHGGVNCHPIKYIIEDDGGDPSRNQAEVQQLVEQAHVIAFVHMDAPIAGQASVGYLTSKRIPVIGEEGGEQWFFESPMYFPQAMAGNALYESEFAAGASVAIPEGRTRLGVVGCVEVGSCSGVYNTAPTASAKYGFQLVYRGQASLAQPDFTSQCQAAESAGAQSFLLALDPNSIERVARSCAGVNYHPQFIIASSTASNQLPSDPLLDGTVANLQVLPWTVTNASIAEMQSVIRQFAPGLQADTTTTPAWATAKLFELATKSISDPPTSQSILQVLWSINRDDLAGLTEPLTFTENQNAPQELCYWTIQIRGGRYISPNNGLRSCH